ncbi:dihydrodipicolinate synthase family protein [Nonomuraea antimicrobica]
MAVDGRRLLGGVMIPLVTPMSEPGLPSGQAAKALLHGLAAAGARSLMLFGSNGEGPLLPVSALTEFAVQVAGQWRELTGGPVLCNVTAAGTAEARQRAAAVAPAEPDALVLSPPIYFRHRDDEIAAHYEALAGLGTPVVAYNAPATATRSARTRSTGWWPCRTWWASRTAQATSTCWATSSPPPGAGRTSA